MFKTTNYFIDTNVFLRLFIKDNKQMYEECLSFFVKKNKLPQQYYTSALVLAEIAWTLRSYYNLSKIRIIKFLYIIQKHFDLGYVDMSDVATANLFFEEYSVKYIDCLIVSALKKTKMNWAIISYVKDFDKIGFRRFTPKEVF